MVPDSLGFAFVEGIDLSCEVVQKFLVSFTKTGLRGLVLNGQQFKVLPQLLYLLLSASAQLALP